MNPNIEQALMNYLGWDPDRESIHLTKEIDADAVHWINVYYNFLHINKIPETTIFISSIGGDLYCTLAITDILNIYNHIKTNVTVLGPAFSGATMITVSANGLRAMTPNSFLMIHDIWNENEKSKPISYIKRESRHLQEIQDKMIDVITAKSKLTRDQILVKLTEDIYYNSEECLSYGLVDIIKKGA